jgi:hypothetical protein
MCLRHALQCNNLLHGILTNSRDKCHVYNVHSIIINLLKAQIIEITCVNNV